MLKPDPNTQDYHVHSQDGESIHALNLELQGLLLPMGCEESIGFVTIELAGYRTEMIRFEMPLKQKSGVLCVVEEKLEYPDIAIETLLQRSPIKVSVSIYDEGDGHAKNVARGQMMEADIPIELVRDVSSSSMGLAGLHGVDVFSLGHLELEIELDCHGTTESGILQLSIDAIEIIAKNFIDFLEQDFMEEEDSKRIDDKFRHQYGLTHDAAISISGEQAALWAVPDSDKNSSVNMKECRQGYIRKLNKNKNMNVNLTKSPVGVEDGDNHDGDSDGVLDELTNSINVLIEGAQDLRRQREEIAADMSETQTQFRSQKESQTQGEDHHIGNRSVVGKPRIEAKTLTFPSVGLNSNEIEVVRIARLSHISKSILETDLNADDDFVRDNKTRKYSNTSGLHTSVIAQLSRIDAQMKKMTKKNENESNTPPVKDRYRNHKILTYTRGKLNF